MGSYKTNCPQYRYLAKSDYWYRNLPLRTSQNNNGVLEIQKDSGTLMTQDPVYTGSVKNGKPHGKGFIKYRNGDTYEGKFRNGEK